MPFRSTSSPRYAQAFLSQPAARTHRGAAAVVSFGVLLAALGVMLVTRTPAPVLPAFLPMVVLALVLTHGFTSLLLGFQASQLQHPTLSLLAGAYAFLGILELCQLMATPGAVSINGLTGSPQDAAWFGVVANFGFPILALVAVFQLQHKRSLLTLWASWLVPSIAALTAAAVIVSFDDLPALVVNNRLTYVLSNILAPAQMGLYSVALLALMLGTHLRTRLHLWLAVALLATLAGVATGISAGERFTVGWYAGRGLTLLSSAVLLAALLWDIHELYSRLHRINAELHEDAIRDGLTGLFQRRYFDKFLARQHEEASMQPLALILLDVDHFKLYNDGFGHPMGDACLTAIANEISNHIRERDGFVARYGGEEMAVVLTGEAAGRVARVAEQLRERVEALHLQHAPATRQPWITLSGGWALANKTWSPASLIRNADQALYAAKHRGRNRTLGYPDVLQADSPLPSPPSP